MSYNVHPDRDFYGPIRHDSVNYGKNQDYTDFPEDGYVKCKKCGFTMNRIRHPVGWGSGTTTVEGDSIVPYGVQIYDTGIYDDLEDDPTVTAGCPFCGTFNYI